MTKKSLYIVLIIVLFFNLISNSQVDGYKFSVKSKLAIEHYLKATRYYDKRVLEFTEKELRTAINIEPKFIEAYLLLGDNFTDWQKYEESINAYKKVIEINPEFFPRIYYLVAKNELRIGRYDDAKKDLLEYKKFIKKDIVEEKRADKLLSDCEFGINAMKNPVPFKPVNLGDSINSADEDYFPTITADEQTIVITRKIRIDKNKSNNIENTQEDIYIAKKIKGKWRKAQNVGRPLNTPYYNEGASYISPDGNYMFFTSCKLADGTIKCDLYYSKKLGDGWAEQINLGPGVNSTAWDSQPSISSDGKTLYFVSTRKSGKGGSDIWTSELQTNGKWSVPINVGDSINTIGDEMYPFIHPDNQTIYFVSTGHQGMGGFDIFYSRRDALGKWTKPVNIGYPINSPADERSLTVDANGNLAYFSSDRLGGRGGLDIYGFELYEKAKPIRVTYMKGIVVNKENNNRLEAKFELIDLTSKKVVVESTSDPITGEFLVCLPTNNNYALNVSKDGFLFYSENFLLTNTANKNKVYEKNIQLQQVKIGETVVLKNIFFETAKFDLKEESFVELQKLNNLLNKNPRLKIEISGHTDNVGGKDYNQKLSENRAKAVFDYLITNGIAKERLTYKGYGDTKPIDTNNAEEGKANNRRTEFKVIEN